MTKRATKKTTTRKNSSKPKRDVYAEVTDKIVAALEAGTAPWVRPWQGGVSGMPVNGSTGKRYRGVNVFLLWASGYSDARWYTFKQAKDCGGSVIKGQKSTGIVFFNWVEKEEADGKKSKIPFARLYAVFNHEQIAWDEDTKPIEPIELTNHDAADLVANTGAKIEHGGSRAYYRRSTDIIGMPEADNFDSEVSYWGTLLHEITHWTGHESRLDRQFGKRFGDESYAAEELVAEMGAAFLCAQAGVEGKLQHPEYLASWLKVLKSDKHAIFTAAREAQKAAEFVLEMSETAQAKAA